MCKIGSLSILDQRIADGDHHICNSLSLLLSEPSCSFNNLSDVLGWLKKHGFGWAFALELGWA